MIVTREDLEAQLQQYQKDKGHHEETLETTRALLDRADIRRKESPAEKKRWDETLNHLEASLGEIKRKLTVADSNILNISRKLENWEEDELSHAPDDMVVVASIEIASSITMNDGTPSKKEQIDAIFQRILTSPLFMVSKLPESDITIAKTLIHSHQVMGMSADQVQEITKRISIYERSKENDMTDKKKPASGEWNSHPGLHAALDKCVKQRHAQLTLADLASIRNYYDAVAALESKNTEDEKRLQILSKSITVINEFLAGFPAT